LGLPAAWNVVLFWLSACTTGFHQIAERTTDYVKKCLDIPKVVNYGVRQTRNFWRIFPKNRASTGLKNKLKVRKLENFAAVCRPNWDRHQHKKAKKIIAVLRTGAMTQLTKNLPGITCKNAKSAIEHGEMMTNTIASWVKKGVVEGPFAKTPLEYFRANPLMAVAQKDKVRPILNLSSPKNQSFNDAVKETAIAKLEMSSAKIFGEEIFRHGLGAVFAKYNIKDAYKLILGNPDQWQCYGFRWLGRYFYDTTTVFGSKSVPANFDALPETLANIVCTTQNLPKRMVHRKLDDVPVVSTRDSGLTKKFADAYVDLCEKIGVPLAEMCPDQEKAFGPGTCGTVLGVRFDSKNLQWSWSQEKVD
jgi:hypothetical protein